MPTTVFNDSNLPILQHEFAHDQQNVNGIYNFSAGNASSPRSSDSSESSSSSYHEESYSPIRSPDTTTEDISGGPYLQILEEPNDKFRFRYKTEMQGTHGAILGINAQKNKSKKTYPRVKLCNYTPNNAGKNPIIRCTLYTADENIDKRVAHVHRLIGKCSGDEREDPHDVIVYGPSYIAVFKNMTILFTKKEEQERVLIGKKQAHIKRRFTDQRQFKILDENKLKMKVSEELNTMNLNVACLQFQALIDNGLGMYTPLCAPVYSQPINNMKNAQTNELRICRVDRCSGSCLGGDEVFMFVEKVVKKNIKVKFFEEGPNKEIVWTDYASFTLDDVHHQYGIAFRTPPYRDPTITNDVEVYFQLERPSDKAVSDPMIFEYLPNPNRRQDRYRKRQRQDSTSNLPTMLNDFIEKPRIWNQENASNSQIAAANTCNFPSVADNNVLCDNIVDFSDIIRDMMQNPMEVQEGFTEEFSSLTCSDWSFDKAFGNVPPADNEAIMQFLNSGRLHDYAMLNGEEEAAQMLTNKPKHFAPGDLVFDGFAKLIRPSKITKPPSHKANPSTSADLTKSYYQGPKDKSPVDMNIPSSQLELGDSIPIQNTRTAFLLTESNIVDKTEKALNDFLKLKQKNKISGKMFQTILKRMFSYVVPETEDSVLHVMAASNQSNVLVQVARYLNFLKIFDVINNVIDSQNCNYETPLHVAASKGSAEMVSMLLDAGANVDATNHMHNTALHLAILRESASMEIVAALLSKTPNLTIHNKDGYNVCHLAVYKRKSDILSSLLIKSEPTGEEPSCDKDLINRQDRKRGNTALHIAVENRFMEVVNLLLLNFDKRIDVNAKNFHGKTPLAFVLGENDPDSKDIAEQLLDNKADPALVDLSNCGKKDEYKNDYEEPEIEIIDIDIEDHDESEYESAYAREWDEDYDLFDKDTISKLCPLLDNDDDWKLLFKRLKFTDSEIDYAKIHWSPSLCAFKLAVLKKPEITAELVRDEILLMSSHLQFGAQYIDDMLLQRLGLD